MKNIFKYIIGCIAMLFATTSCQDMTEDTTLNGVDDGVAISIVANCTATRSSALDTSKNFYLSFAQTDGESYFVKVKSIGGEWVAYSVDDESEEVDMKYFASHAAPSIIAFDCGEASLVESDFNSASSLYTSDGYDMLYASTAIDGTITISSAGVITITFEHILSQLNIALNIEDDSAASSVVISGVYDSFTFDASTNSSFAVSEEVVDLNFVEESDNEFYAIMVPQSLKGAKIVVTMESGEVYSCTIADDKILTAGVLNRLPLIIDNGDVVVDNEDVVAVKSLAIASWIDIDDYHTLVMN